MTYCERCGAELDPLSGSCARCAAEAGQAEPAQAGSPVPDQPPPGGCQPPLPPAVPPAPAGKGARAAVIAAVAGLGAAALALVLLLGFAVGPKWFVSEDGDRASSEEGAAGEGGPERAVEAFYRAMQKGDASAMLSLVEPDNRRQLDLMAQAQGFTDGLALLNDYINTAFPLRDLQINGLELESEVKGDTATVRVIGGKATYTGAGGNIVKESYTDRGDVFGDGDFEMVKKGGKWYIELEVAGSSTDGGGNQADSGSGGSGTSTSRSDPEKVVGAYFQAMKDKDSRLLISTFSPSSVAQLESQLAEAGYGSLETFFEEFFFSSYQSIDFQGLKLETSEKGDTATVKVLEGKAVIVDEDGQTTVEDVLDADIPVEIPMVREGGRWYIDFMGMAE